MEVSWVWGALVLLFLFFIFRHLMNVLAMYAAQRSSLKMFDRMIQRAHDEGKHEEVLKLAEAKGKMLEMFVKGAKAASGQADGN